MLQEHRVAAAWQPEVEPIWKSPSGHPPPTDQEPKMAGHSRHAFPVLLYAPSAPRRAHLAAREDLQSPSGHLPLTDRKSKISIPSVVICSRHTTSRPLGSHRDLQNSSGRSLYHTGRSEIQNSRALKISILSTAICSKRTASRPLGSRRGLQSPSGRSPPTGQKSKMAGYTK